MKRISSGSLFFSKKVFPVLWFGILFVVLAISLVSGAYRAVPVLVIMPVFMTVFGYFMIKKLVGDLVDEVFDGGDFLLVRNGDQEDRVPLSNIMNVSASMLINPPRITLRLIKPGKFGSEIAFSPVRPMFRNPFARNKVAEDLMIRVHRTRTRREDA
jgi:hypothetical protein